MGKTSYEGGRTCRPNVAPLPDGAGVGLAAVLGLAGTRLAVLSPGGGGGLLGGPGAGGSAVAGSRRSAGLVVSNADGLHPVLAHGLHAKRVAVHADHVPALGEAAELPEHEA